MDERSVIKVSSSNRCSFLDEAADMDTYDERRRDNKASNIKIPSIIIDNTTGFLSYINLMGSQYKLQRMSVRVKVLHSTVSPYEMPKLNVLHTNSTTRKNLN